MKDPEKVKGKILLLLSRRGKLPTTEISVTLRENYWRAVVLLEQLELKKLIKRSSRGSFVYWELVEVKK